jgi:multimeric flavodoxin WrbA
MSLKVLGISTSPRKGGNSDLLLLQALAGAHSAGAITEYIRLSDFDIRPCTECNCCYADGVCIIADDYQQILDKILHADRLIFATPIYFMIVCAQAKMLIDRGQSVWALRHILKKQPSASQPAQAGRAMVIAVGGSKSKKQFESVRLTMKSYFDALGINYVFNLFVNQVDSLGAITGHPTALNEAFRLGCDFASPNLPAHDKQINVELF